MLAVWFGILLDVLSFLDDNEDLLTIRFIMPGGEAALVLGVLFWKLNLK